MKKGYTLVEMIVVVALLALIFLVAIPNVMNTLTKVNSEKYSRYLNDVFLATETYLEANMDNYENKIKEKEKIYISFSQLLTSGYLKPSIYDPKNEKTVKNENFTVEVYFENDSNEYHYKLHEENLNYTIVSGDLDTVGSIVRIADEEFYVIGQEDSTHVKLFAKWNLNVGQYNCENSHNDCPMDLLGESGLQSEAAGVLYGSDGEYFSTIYDEFSTYVYWYDYSNDKLKDEFGGYDNNDYGQYIDSNNNPVFPYVYTDRKENGEYINTQAKYINDYVNYLKSQGVNVTGRLISKEELESLGCDYDVENCSNAEQWVYRSSYWTGSADSGGASLIAVKSEYPAFESHQFWTNYYDGLGEFAAGTRPVIILEK